MESQTFQIPEVQLNGPALQPPPGVVPDFEHPWNLNSVGRVTNALCLTATILACSIRVYSKLFCSRKIQLEEVHATYLGCIWCSYRIISTSGTFTHQWNIRLRDLSSTLYIHHLAINFLAVTLGLSKAAILLEWTRIFVPHGTRNLFYWVYKSLLAIVCLIHMAFVVAENLSCIPHKKIWDRTIPRGYCIDDKAYHIPGALVSPICILIILILAQRAIWKLKMSRDNKTGISLIFLVGVLSLGASIVRVDATFKFLMSEDKTHTVGAVYLWTLAELTFAFLAFCAPTAPRAYANRHSIANFMLYLMSCVGLSTRRTTSGTGARSWPSPLPSPTEPGSWDTPKMYHKIKDTTTASLASPQAAKPQFHELTSQDGILVTTSFTAEITRLAEPAATHVHEMEYTWTSGP
ncbi:hypothetical protein F5Y07DRAFT_392111 [Xylaria sp. FL0933]|nr:hypothetical protein F5Y07DRAFT_392111 [Xylaria sp. FL0933]